MKWTDITSYSRMDTERTPRALECRLTPHIFFKVHKYIHCGNTWFLTASCVNLEMHNLNTEDLETAKEKAASIMSQKLTERQTELATALSELSQEPHHTKGA